MACILFCTIKVTEFGIQGDTSSRGHFGEALHSLPFLWSAILWSGWANLCSCCGVQESSVFPLASSLLLSSSWDSGWGRAIYDERWFDSPLYIVPGD